MITPHFVFLYGKSCFDVAEFLYLSMICNLTWTQEQVGGINGEVAKQYEVQQRRKISLTYILTFWFPHQMKCSQRDVLQKWLVLSFLKNSSFPCIFQVPFKAVLKIQMLSLTWPFHFIPSNKVTRWFAFRLCFLCKDISTLDAWMSWFHFSQKFLIWPVLLKIKANAFLCKI